MRLAYACIFMIVIFFMAFIALSSSAAYPAPSQINYTANPYLDTTGGLYGVNLTAYVYDESCNPAVDGTVVDFNINAPDVTFGGIPTSYTSQYFPIRNGSLNGNNSQYASRPTSGGKAVVRYGWFPDNKIPTGFVKITAALNNTPSVKSTLYLEFNGTIQARAVTVPTVIDIAPSTPTPMSSPTQSSLPTPLSTMIALLSLTIGAAIVLAVRRK